MSGLSAAWMYHAHHSSYRDDIPFWLEKADKTGGPILELGCGTGRVLLPLAEKGEVVVGIDRDRDMLSILQNSLKTQSGSRPLILQADFTQFNLSLQFGLILMTCNTYSTLTTKERWFTLQRVRKHLLPKGAFAVSMPNPILLRRMPAKGNREVEEFLLHPQDNEPLQVSSEWKRDSQYFLIYWHYDHLLPNGRVERCTINVRQNLLPVEVYRAEMQEAGFKSIVDYGDFDGREYTDTSPHLILMACGTQG